MSKPMNFADKNAELIAKVEVLGQRLFAERYPPECSAELEALECAAVAACEGMVAQRVGVENLQFYQDKVERFERLASLASQAYPPDFCRVCGWYKGGKDSWNGRACKCGHTS